MSSAYSREGPNASVVGAEWVGESAEQNEDGEMPEACVSSVPHLIPVSSVSPSVKWSCSPLTAFMSRISARSLCNRPDRHYHPPLYKWGNWDSKCLVTWPQNHTSWFSRIKTQTQCFFHHTVTSSTSFVNFNNSNPNSEVSLYNPALLKRDLIPMMWINRVFQSAA